MILILAGMLIGLVFAVFLAGAFVLKALWPLFFKSEEPDFDQAFRYIGVAVVVLLITIFFGLLVLLPGPG